VHRLLALLSAVALVPSCAGVDGRTQSDRATEPEIRISRAEFVSLIDELSEREGYFDTDNFITNETSYLHVVGRLKEQVPPGGVYLGVGPDQNFSYIVHTEPSLAVIVDIRRQNMLQHLLFKVLIEEADGRLDYLCTLLARDCAGVGSGDFPAMLAGVREAPGSETRLGDATSDVRRALVEEYGIRLTASDLEQIEYVQRSFAQAGLSLRFSTFGRSPAGYPTFEEILTGRDLEGRYQSYLSSDALFERLQTFQRENRLVPVVGDFGGNDAMRRVAEFLGERSLAVSVFYASNVEFYLFGSPDWDRYLGNLGRFPFRDDSVFIRSYFPTGWPIHPQNVPGHRPTSLVQDVAGFFDDVETGRQRTYWDVVTRHLR